MSRLLCTLCLVLCFAASLYAENAPKFVELKGHDGNVNFASFSPDGKKIVTASKDKTVRVWEAESGKELKKLEGHTDEVNSASFSPDGKKIVTASWDRTARIWDAESGEELKKFSGVDYPLSHIRRRPLPLTLAFIFGWEEPKSIRFASFSPDGKEIVVALNITIRIWDAESGEERQWFAGHFPNTFAKFRILSHGTDSALYSPYGEKIVTAGSYSVRVWDVKSGEKQHELSAHYRPHFASFSPDEKNIVMTARNNIYFWDADKGGDVLRTFKYSQYDKEPLNWAEGEGLSVNYSPDGKKLVVAMGSKENFAHIVDAETGKELQKLEGHTDRVVYAAFSPDGKKIVTASRDNTARIWDLSALENQQ